MKQPFKIAIFLVCLGVAVALYRTFAVRDTTASVPTAPRQTVVPKAPVAPSAVPRTVSGDSVIEPGAGKWSLRQQPPAQATIEETIANDLPSKNKHMVRLRVTAVDPDKYWAAQMLKEVPQEVQAGKNMLIRFWGRSRQSTPIWVMFEAGASPHAPEIQKQVRLSPEWKEYTMPFSTKQSHREPHANFCIKAGIQIGEIEVAGIRVEEY